MKRRNIRHINNIKLSKRISSKNFKNNPVKKQSGKSNKVKASKENTCFVTGCDRNYEWAIPWWYKNYIRHNKDYKLIFVNLGMSDKALNWCKTKGEILDINYNFHKAWFCKPVVLRSIPYEYGIWIDMDCEVRKSLNALITYSNYGFAVTIDKYAKSFCGGMQNPVATGVVGCNKNNEILIEWEQKTLEASKDFRGDQEVLNHILKKRKMGRKRYKDIAIMPKEMQWLRLDGDNKNAAIMHWTGPAGDEIIKKQIKEQKINFNNV